MSSDKQDPNFATATPLPPMTVDSKDGREAADLSPSEVPGRVLDPLHIDMEKMTPVPLLRLTLTFAADAPPGRAAAEVDAVCREVDRTERRLGGAGLDWRITANDDGRSVLLTFRPLHMDGARTAERLREVAGLLDAHLPDSWPGWERCSAELQLDEV